MVTVSLDDRFDATPLDVLPIEALPFDGFKCGRRGREDLRFASEEVTQPRVVRANRGQASVGGKGQADRRAGARVAAPGERTPHRSPPRLGAGCRRWQGLRRSRFRLSHLQGDPGQPAAIRMPRPP